MAFGIDHHFGTQFDDVNAFPGRKNCTLLSDELTPFCSVLL
jgi:hypothetical protein